MCAYSCLIIASSPCRPGYQRAGMLCTVNQKCQICQPDWMRQLLHQIPSFRNREGKKRTKLYLEVRNRCGVKSSLNFHTLLKQKTSPSSMLPPSYHVFLSIMSSTIPFKIHTLKWVFCHCGMMDSSMSSITPQL